MRTETDAQQVGGAAKAGPIRLVDGRGWADCAPEEATHLTLHFPGPSGVITLPVIQKGSRDGTPCWTWNGCVERPTLRPSIRTRGGDYLCHSWVSDGMAVFLDDCTHALRGQTLEMLPVPQVPQPEPADV